jgi:hypothetical protein
LTNMLINSMKWSDGPATWRAPISCSSFSKDSTRRSKTMSPALQVDNLQTRTLMSGTWQLSSAMKII